MEKRNTENTASGEEVNVKTKNDQSHDNQKVSRTVRGYVLDSRTDNIRNLYTLCRTSRRGEIWDTWLHKESREYYACKSILRKFITEKVQPQIKIMHRLAGQENIGIKAVYEDHLGVHIVMEPCTGSGLLDRIENMRKCYSEKDAAKLIKIILEVIDLCHSHGVAIGGDWKTFIFADDKKDCDSLKAVYFGSAKIFELDGLVKAGVEEKKKALKRDIQEAGYILCALLTRYKHQSGTELNFEKDPLKTISEPGKELIKEMVNGLAAYEVLSNPWFRENGVVPENASKQAVSNLEKFICTLEESNVKIGE